LSCPFCAASGIYKLFHFLELYLDRSAGGHPYNEDITADPVSHHQLVALTSVKLVLDRQVPMCQYVLVGRPVFVLGTETKK
jgi:hypothetical protein